MMPKSDTPTAGGPGAGRAGRAGALPRTLARLVRGKSINPDTLLATDYLNHFNELIMLLDLVPDMPDCLEDALAWRPKSYPQHFRDSAFADRELAILAYENSPDRYRLVLEETVAGIDALATTALPEIASAAAGTHDELLDSVVQRHLHKFRILVARANDIIHGTVQSIDQPANDATATCDQDEIDRLMEA